MTYETVATISQVSSLLLFIALFVGVLIYAVWPKNKPRFEDAQRRALDLDQSDTRQRGPK
jgi:cytochrome c oxidase cbb3-type subunit IV